MNLIKTLLIIFLFALCAGYAHTQNLGNLQGVVKDEATQKPLPNVSILLVGTTIGDATNQNGFFELSNLKTGTYTIKATLIGYKPSVISNIKVNDNSPATLEFSLKPTFIKLRDVEIEADRLWDKYLNEASLVGVQRMRAREIKNIPGSWDDPTRAVQIFSGVSGGGDFSGFMAVRGGSPDQNQVIIDGVVVPNPYRFRLAFGGGLSTINPNTTEDIYLHLGGFSAEYGNSMTSILEVESKSGNRKHLRTQGSINFTDVNGLVEGPLPFLSGSFIFSIRRTYYDLILNQVTKSNSIFPFFSEVYSKISFDINKTNKINLTFTNNVEGTDLTGDFSNDLNLTEDVNSNIIGLNWRKLHGDKWRFDTTLSFYKDKMQYRAFPLDTTNIFREFESIDARLTNIAVKENIRYQTGEKSWLTFGVSATRKPTKIKFNSAELNFLYARIESPRDINFDKNHDYYAAFVESSTQASQRLHFRIGARYDYSTLINESEISPRFSMWYQLDDRTTFNGSWGVFYQYPNPMSIYTRNIPVDLSSNLDVISAEKSTHLIGGIERILNDDLTVKLQVYNKDIDRLLLPISTSNFSPTNNGVGYARGFEFVLEKKPTANNHFNAVLTYSFGKAQFREIDTRKWLPFKYDRRHALTALTNIRLFGKWSLSLLGQYTSGLPFTDVLGLINVAESNGRASWGFVRGQRFQSNFPAYKKVDARISYQSRVKGKHFSFYVDIINLTNEQNLYEITWEKKFVEQDVAQATVRKIYTLPLIPSFGLSFKL